MKLIDNKLDITFHMLMSHLCCHIMPSVIDCDVIHYNDVIMSVMASQITGILIVYSPFCSGADKRTHQSSVSLGFVRGIHQWPVNSLHKGPVQWMSPFDYIIMISKTKTEWVTKKDVGGSSCHHHLWVNFLRQEITLCMYCHDNLFMCLFQSYFGVTFINIFRWVSAWKM